MKILNELGIKVNNQDLFDTAFTHTSYANECGVESYERLEYLGDAVLEMVMSEYLYNNTTSNEGDMTKTRAHYVCENALYEYSLDLKLNDYLRLGRGETENGGKFRKAIVADIFESFLGALFLDQGIEAVNKFMKTYIFPMMEKGLVNSFHDYKSVLQELVQTDKRSLEYKMIREEGPSHNKLFTAEVRIDDIVYGTGSAHSKKEAEQEAAKDALKKSVR
ncbi:MAG: ribonuclease III [Bacilli bacterium]|nr:ribonuclease III [Bacilli bacterium]